MKHSKIKVFGASKTLFSRRGISPLIATVLIIGFCIALAAIVMTWGGGFVRTTTEKTEASADLSLKCSTELDFTVSSAESDAITIDNRGNVEIETLMFRFFDANGAMVGTAVDTEGGAKEGVAAYAVETFTVTFPADSVKVEAIARIPDPSTGKTHTCGQAGRERVIATA